MHLIFKPIFKPIFWVTFLYPRTACLDIQKWGHLPYISTNFAGWFSCIWRKPAWIFRNGEMYLIIKFILLSNIVLSEMGKCTLYLNPFSRWLSCIYKDSLLGYYKMGKCTLYIKPFLFIVRIACKDIQKWRNAPYTHFAGNLILILLGTL